MLAHCEGKHACQPRRLSIFADNPARSAPIEPFKGGVTILFCLPPFFRREVEVLEVIDDKVIKTGIADAVVFFNPFRRVRQVEMELRVMSGSGTSGRVN